MDWAAVRADIAAELGKFPNHDDGTIAPVVLRLAWHSSGTYDPVEQPNGGSNGATMRYV